MSYRPHPLRHTYTVDLPSSSLERQPSTTSSSASSAYSNHSLGSSAYSTHSSVTSNGHGPATPAAYAHKRGMSEASVRHSPSRPLPLPQAQDDPKPKPESMYSLARQSLKPLAQSPASGPPSARSTPRHERHDRGQSLDIGRLSLAPASPLDRSPVKSPERSPIKSPEKSPIKSLERSPVKSPEKSPSPTKYASPSYAARPLPAAPGADHDAPRTPPRHGRLDLVDRGQSVDMGRFGTADGRTSPSPQPRNAASRPTSMLLTRSDSVRPGPPGHSHHSHTSNHSPLAAPDLQQLGRSTTDQLRTLSKLAENGSPNDFSITSPEQEVAGLRGRRRLQNSAPNTPRGNRYGFEGRNWMDKQRQFLQAYEYLCHIGEAKEWIEDIINCQIPPIVELEEALRDGVTLAEVVEALTPDRRTRIFRHPRLQARHWDNIAAFFRYLDEVEMPDLFRFELIDLYEKKNIPKVIYCIHALSWLLFRKGIVDFRIGNLVGQLEFEHHELEAMQKGLDKLGVNMPSFGNMGADFGVQPPTPEPEETEEERIDRELAENEGMIVDLQAQIRGATLRMQLADVMQNLWDSEDWIVDLQSRIRGDFSRQISGYRLEMRRFAVNLQSAARGCLLRNRMAHEEDMKRFAIILQSAARGFLVRNSMARQEQFWKSREKDVIQIQSMLRARKARSQVQHTRSQLQLADGPIRSIQAHLRGYLQREQVTAQQEETSLASGPVMDLQSAIRGMLAREKVGQDMFLLSREENSIEGLQANIRAMLSRNILQRQQASLESFTPQWERLQAASRGVQQRQEITTLKAELRQHTTELGSLQAHIRAAAVRRNVADKLDALSDNEEAIVQLQALARAMLERQRIADELDSLDAQTDAITDLQSRIRGCLSREQHSNFLDELETHEDEITSLQALSRAMLLRARVGDLLNELDENEEAVVDFQAQAKAFIVRAKFVEKKKHFNENMSKVVKIQSFVRGKLQGEAYKGLTTGKNPPVGAVKNFVHLLNDSDFDFNEEVEFERLRKTVVQQVRQNEMLEQYIDQLDIKIALLVKNKITIDEVVRHQSNYGGHTSSLLANTSISSANQFDLKALNKSSRKKLESYQQLFFNLQTQPQYLARLFKRLREQGTADKESKRIEHLMMGLFGYAQKRREEYYLLKLLSKSIREEVETCQSPQDFLRGNFFWSKLFNNYTRSPRDRKYLRDLFAPLIRDNIIEDPALDLESDPMQIYRSAINNEELRTGRPSHRPLDIPRDAAIKDQETRELFIDHLRDLREISDQFFVALEDLLPRMPYGLRFICQQIFEALQQRFRREPPQHVLQLVSNWVWRFYLQPALVNPEQVGVIEKTLSPLQKRNLGEVAKVLGQVASGRPFGGENIYLQPLNAFIGESIERLAHITNSLISVPDAERTFDIDEFNDLYAKNKPTLYIKMTDIFAVHTLVAQELPTMCPGRDDILREIMQDLGSAKNNESEMFGAGSSDIQMFLTPKLHDMDDPEANVKALFMETKRCILYIIRVQTGSNLLEILVRPPTPEDEHKWQSVLREDFMSGENTKGAYSDVNMVDVTRMSYYDMKRNALENIMHLEQMGRVSKQNYYQDVLNAIALDIRTKSRRRIQRQRELEGVRLTLSNLHHKAKYLEQQRKSYDDYIEQAMATLQKNKGKKRFLLPFTKQYNHQRELERTGRVPKFGSYKYSVRALAEKGVVVAWQGVPDRDWGAINLTISCDEVGIFNLEGSRGHIQIPGASAQMPIEHLLQAQFEAHQFMNMFEGNLRLNVNLLLHLLYKKFYRTQ